MSTSTSAPLSASTSANAEPTIVETLDEAAFILEENPDAVRLQPLGHLSASSAQSFTAPVAPCTLPLI